MAIKKDKFFNVVVCKPAHWMQDKSPPGGCRGFDSGRIGEYLAGVALREQAGVNAAPS